MATQVPGLGSFLNAFTAAGSSVGAAARAKDQRDLGYARLGLQARSQLLDQEQFDEQKRAQEVTEDYNKQQLAISRASQNRLNVEDRVEDQQTQAKIAIDLAATGGFFAENSVTMLDPDKLKRALDGNEGKLKQAEAQNLVKQITNSIPGGTLQGSWNSNLVKNEDTGNYAFEVTLANGETAPITESPPGVPLSDNNAIVPEFSSEEIVQRAIAAFSTTVMGNLNDDARSRLSVFALESNVINKNAEAQKLAVAQATEELIQGVIRETEAAYEQQNGIELPEEERVKINRDIRSRVLANPSPQAAVREFAKDLPKLFPLVQKLDASLNLTAGQTTEEPAPPAGQTTEEPAPPAGQTTEEPASGVDAFMENAAITLSDRKTTAEVDREVRRLTALQARDARLKGRNQKPSKSKEEIRQQVIQEAIDKREFTIRSEQRKNRRAGSSFSDEDRTRIESEIASLKQQLQPTAEPEAMVNEKDEGVEITNELNNTPKNPSYDDLDKLSKSSAFRNFYSDSKALQSFRNKLNGMGVDSIPELNNLNTKDRALAMAALIAFVPDSQQASIRQAYNNLQDTGRVDADKGKLATERDVVADNQRQELENYYARFDKELDRQIDALKYDQEVNNDVRAALTDASAAIQETTSSNLEILIDDEKSVDDKIRELDDSLTNLDRFTAAYAGDTNSRVRNVVNLGREAQLNVVRQIITLMAKEKLGGKSGIVQGTADFFATSPTGQVDFNRIIVDTEDGTFRITGSPVEDRATGRGRPGRPQGTVMKLNALRDRSPEAHRLLLLLNKAGELAPQS